MPGDPAYYRGTDVLVNKHDLRDPEMASVVEYKFAFARELELEVAPIQGAFDFAHLQAIHRHVFQDTYAWAGELRSVDFAKRNKETGMVSQFARLVDVPAKVREFNAYMQAHKQLKGLPKDEFVKRFAEVHTKLNELHPFREGNGRSARIFLRQLAREAGHELRIDLLDGSRWNLASHKAQVQHSPKDPSIRIPGSPAMMRELFAASTRPTIEHAFRHETRADALRLYPGLKPYFQRLDVICSKAKVLASPLRERELVEMARTRLFEKLRADRMHAEREQAHDRLSEIRPGFKNVYGKTDDYLIVVAAAMKEVFVRQGFNPRDVDASLQRRFGSRDKPLHVQHHAPMGALDR